MQTQPQSLSFPASGARYLTVFLFALVSVVVSLAVIIRRGVTGAFSRNEPAEDEIPVLTDVVERDSSGSV